MLCSLFKKVTPVGDPTNKSQEIIALEAKCAELAASLQQGQTQNAFLQNEVSCTKGTVKLVLEIHQFCFNAQYSFFLIDARAA